MTLIQVYYPTSDEEDKSIKVYSGIEKLCKLAKGEDNLIIMGNWIAIVEEGQARVFKLGTIDINVRRDLFVDCKQNDMTIIIIS